MKILEWITSFIVWLQIVLFPAFLGFIGGLMVYGIYPTTAGKVFGIIIAVAGLVIGIVFATRVWKKQGTVNFIARVSATPELDTPEENQP